MRAVESYVAGRWIGAADGRPVHDAVTGEVIASVSSDGVDLAAAHTHARTVAGPALRELTFHDRAAILRAVGKMLLADNDELYALSYSTGATRADSASSSAPARKARISPSSSAGTFFSNCPAGCGLSCARTSRTTVLRSPPRLKHRSIKSY